MIHELKTDPVHFNDVLAGLKGYEVRVDDRSPRFDVGHILVLQEYTACQYTGRVAIVGPITHVLRDFYGLQPGFCVLGFTPLKVAADADMRREQLQRERSAMMDRLAQSQVDMRAHYREIVHRIDAELDQLPRSK